MKIFTRFFLMKMFLYSKCKIKSIRYYSCANGIDFSCLLFAGVTEAAKNSPH